MDIALALDRLVPAAEYGGSVTANTKAAFDAVRWDDSRPKPSWADITATDTFLATTVEELLDLYKWSGSAWVADEDKKTEAVALAKREINTHTQDAILNDFTHGAYSFFLTFTDQFNHKANYDMRALLDYPYEVEHKDGVLNLADADEYETFYFAGVTHIRTAVFAGRAQKQSLAAKTVAEIIDLIKSLEA